MSDESPKPLEPTEPKRRWYQYSLRSLLIVMVLFCFLFAWIGYKVRQGQKQKEVVAWVEKNGGNVLYDMPYNPEANRIASNDLSSRGFLSVWIGVDYFHNVNSVTFRSYKVDRFFFRQGSDELTTLQELPLLRNVYFHSVRRPSSKVLRNLLAGLPKCEFVWSKEYDSETWQYGCKQCNEWHDAHDDPHAAPE